MESQVSACVPKIHKETQIPLKKRLSQYLNTVDMDPSTFVSLHII
jgi:hypothetical protein